MSHRTLRAFMPSLFFISFMALSVALSACTSFLNTATSTSASCAAAPSATTSRLVNSISVLLMPQDKTNAPSQAEMQASCSILSQRLTSYGLKGSSVSVITTNGQLGIQVVAPHFGGNEQQTITSLVKPGLLEFWDTGQTAAIIEGQTFDPIQFTQYNPGNKPEFTGADLDPNQVSVGQDQSGLPAINFAMKSSAASRFASFTANHIGDYLTITLDRIVISSPIIQGAIPGDGQITGHFTVQQANALASSLKYASLPVALEIVSIQSS